MTRSTAKVLVAGAVIVAATIVGTQQILSLFPADADSAPGAEHASFLAHVLLPLTVVLGIFVAITVVGLGARVVRALLSSTDEDS